MSTRVAVIDLGTNTFHLTVAELKAGGFTILAAERLPVKIGMGGINQGVITEAGISRAIKALSIFRDRLAAYQPSRVIAFGTSAFRHAQNRQHIVKKIKTETGIEVNVISGDQEAEYIFYGVRAAVPMTEEKSLVVDIGGGSVEFIIGNQTEFFWKHSFEIGAQRLLEKFHIHDPIHPEELVALYQYFDEHLLPLFEALKKHPVKTLIGSSGTFDTLSDIHCIREGLSANPLPETPLTIPSFHSIFQELKQKSRSERMLIPGMIELRVDMIVVACALIDFLLAKSAFDRIRVSSYSLKEGVLASLLPD